MTSAIAAALPGSVNVSGLSLPGKPGMEDSQKFGSVFASFTKSQALKETADPLNSSQLEQLEDIVSMLNLDSMTEWEDGSAMAKQLIMGESPLSGLLEAVESKEGRKFQEAADILGEELGVPAETKTEDGQSVDVSQLLSLMLPLAKLDVKEISKLDLSAFSQVIKTAKLLSLGSEFMDLTKEQAAGFEKIKGILGILAEKLQTGITQPNAVSETISKDNSSPANLFQLNMNTPVQTAKEAFARVPEAGSAETDSWRLKKYSPEAGSQTVSFNTPLPKLEMLTLSLDSSVQRADQNKFIQQFENILAKAHMTNVNGIQKLFIKLNPEHLGSLRIEIIQKDSMVAAKIVASTSQAKDALEAHINGLKHAFASQNIPVDRIEVSQQFSQFSSERFMQQDHQGQRERQQPQQKKQDENQDFEETFEDALLNMEV